MKRLYNKDKKILSLLIRQKKFCGIFPLPGPPDIRHSVPFSIDVSFRDADCKCYCTNLSSCDPYTCGWGNCTREGKTNNCGSLCWDNCSTDCGTNVQLNLLKTYVRLPRSLVHKPQCEIIMFLRAHPRYVADAVAHGQTPKDRLEDCSFLECVTVNYLSFMIRLTASATVS